MFVVLATCTFWHPPPCNFQSIRCSPSSLFTNTYVYFGFRHQYFFPVALSCLESPALQHNHQYFLPNFPPLHHPISTTSFHTCAMAYLSCGHNLFDVQFQPACSDDCVCLPNAPLFNILHVFLCLVAPSSFSCLSLLHFTIFIWPSNIPCDLFICPQYLSIPTTYPLNPQHCAITCIHCPSCSQTTHCVLSSPAREAPHIPYISPSLITVDYNVKDIVMYWLF